VVAHGVQVVDVDEAVEGDRVAGDAGTVGAVAPTPVTGPSCCPTPPAMV